MKLELFDKYLTIILAYQLFFIAVFLTGTGFRKNISRKVLSVFFICALIYYLTLGSYYTGYVELSIYLYYLFVPALLTICPAFYLYAKSLTEEDFRISRQHLLHLLPTAISLVLNVGLFGSLTFEEKKWFIIYGFSESTSIQAVKLNIYFVFIWNYLILIPQLVYYIILIFRAIIQHRQKIMESFSSIESIQLRWLQWAAILFFFTLVLNNGLIQTDATDIAGVRIFYNICMIALTAFIGIYGLRQVNIYNQLAFQTNQPAVHISETDSCKKTLVKAYHNRTQTAKKYKAELLTDSERFEIVNRLTEIMKQKKMFLNPKLKISDVANELKLNRRQISQAVNSALNNNFYHFVNEFRINEARRLMQKSEYAQYSIEGIALQSGFKSRSSFYTAFKDKTGLTPNKYRSKYKIKN